MSKAGLTSIADDLALVESTQIHVFLSIITLMFLLRLMTPALPESLFIAMLSCISAPSTYALAYYSLKSYKPGRFVSRKNPEPARMWRYEVSGLLIGFAVSFLMYYALGGVDYVSFTASFIVVQVMRALIALTVGFLGDRGVDVHHPLVILLVSGSSSLIGLLLLESLYTLLA